MVTPTLTFRVMIYEKLTLQAPDVLSNFSQWNFCICWWDSFVLKLKKKSATRRNFPFHFFFSPISSINIFFPSFTDTFPRYLTDFYHVRGIWFHLVRACLRACMFSVANKWSFFFCLPSYCILLLRSSWMKNKRDRVLVSFPPPKKSANLFHWPTEVDPINIPLLGKIGIDA